MKSTGEIYWDGSIIYEEWRRCFLCFTTSSPVSAPQSCCSTIPKMISIADPHLMITFWLSAPPSMFTSSRLFRLSFLLPASIVLLLAFWQLWKRSDLICSQNKKTIYNGNSPTPWHVFALPIVVTKNCYWYLREIFRCFSDRLSCVITWIYRVWAQ